MQILFLHSATVIQKLMSKLQLVESLATSVYTVMIAEKQSLKIFILLPKSTIISGIPHLKRPV